MKTHRIISSTALLCTGALLSAHAQQSASTNTSTTSKDAQGIVVTRGDSRAPRTGAPENFTGSVRIEPLFPAIEPSRVSGGSVTFEPGARTAWHSHPLGQMLIVTAGTGRVQRWGDVVQEIHPGDVVWIPPGQKHWHGAAPDSRMTHIAIQEARDGRNVDWMDPVTDPQYGR
jgi:4-carboxymuconolactone decarboxylase